MRDDDIMAFPWTNLVTAVATLAAALGATYIKGIFDSSSEQRRLRHEHELRRTDIRAEAYSDFLKAAHADARLLGQTIVQLSQSEPDMPTLNEIAAITSKAIDEFNSTRARVEIVGSASASSAVSAVARAARALGARCSHAYLQVDSFDTVAAEAELEDLSGAIDAFAASCRIELDPSS